LFLGEERRSLLRQALKYVGIIGKGIKEGGTDTLSSQQTNAKEPKSTKVTGGQKTTRNFLDRDGSLNAANCGKEGEEGSQAQGFGKSDFFDRGSKVGTTWGDRTQEHIVTLPG